MAHLARAGESVSMPNIAKTSCLEIFSASLGVHPFMCSDRIDADACERAQPFPVHPISSIISSFMMMSMASESPQERLLVSA